ncbi:MAG: ABC transporter permease [Alphaproteobacteria bacterium]|nr:ABC transporter permease [Alphaproteobacteria bacterium]MBU0796325.1 ABC transporter permease [Alphaproteobacteria bacterium]MBU0889158.1 ABC transporter permease [Alphaproteobacteria bacterium]MBU1812192.1 ABC transporter permease [Alphaproteobacteria bacterium]MBU2089783.1 ABC transporter permease [Alphaproteobacteria bacterium]
MANTELTSKTATPLTRSVDGFKRALNSDLFYSFKHSPVTIVAMAVTLLIIFTSVFANLVAPHNPFDVATMNLLDSELPPVWAEMGDPKYLLGTDNLGRDVFSTILYGSRVSLFVGFTSVVLSMVIGIALGLIAGYKGGLIDAFIMRVAEIQLSFPTILVALLINGVMRGVLPPSQHAELAVLVLVLSIGLSNWVQFARTVRASTLVERNKEYVLAARLIGVKPLFIMIRHVLPNVMGPILVIATLGLASAVLTEATLSFLGVGVPPTEPSLGTLINVGSDYLFSGSWWITIFPGAALAILVLAVNLVGDWLRDALNPKLR